MPNTLKMVLNNLERLGYEIKKPVWVSPGKKFIIGGKYIGSARGDKSEVSFVIVPIDSDRQTINWHFGIVRTLRSTWQLEEELTIKDFLYKEGMLRIKRMLYDNPNVSKLEDCLLYPTDPPKPFPYKIRPDKTIEFTEPIEFLIFEDNRVQREVMRTLYGKDWDCYQEDLIEAVFCEPIILDRNLSELMSRKLVSASGINSSIGISLTAKGASLVRNLKEFQRQFPEPENPVSMVKKSSIPESSGNQSELKRDFSKFEYDVALSFAGENRKYADKLASLLSEAGCKKIFYDKYKQSELWGRNLHDHFDWVYRKASRFCVMFISKHYASKFWTNHERKSAQARAFMERSEYILPVKIDDTEIPGLPPTICCLDIRETSIENIAELLLKKLDMKN